MMKIGTGQEKVKRVPKRKTMIISPFSADKVQKNDHASGKVFDSIWILLGKQRITSHNQACSGLVTGSHGQLSLLGFRYFEEYKASPTIIKMGADEFFFNWAHDGTQHWDQENHYQNELVTSIPNSFN
jgi:hypothetical protein